MKEPAQVIADAIRTNLHQPHRAKEAAQAVIGALASAGFAIIPRRPGRSRLVVERNPGPRPLMTNAIAGDQGRRGVFTDEDAE
jgi:hypothetical protein